MISVNCQICIGQWVQVGSAMPWAMGLCWHTEIMYTCGGIHNGMNMALCHPRVGMLRSNDWWSAGRLAWDGRELQHREPLGCP